MSLKPELASLLEGVESEAARTRIVNAYHSLSGSDPEGFAVQFAILGAAIASRIERSVELAHAAVGEAGNLDHSPDAVAQKVLKHVPGIRELKQLADSLKVAVGNLDRGGGRGANHGWINFILISLTLANTVMLGYILWMI